MPGSLSGEVCASHHKPDLMQKTGQFSGPIRYRRHRRGPHRTADQRTPRSPRRHLPRHNSSRLQTRRRKQLTVQNQRTLERRHRPLRHSTFTCPSRHRKAESGARRSETRNLGSQSKPQHGGCNQCWGMAKRALRRFNRHTDEASGTLQLSGFGVTC